MQTYSFYVKDNNVKIILKSELSESKKIKLKEEGFKKHHIEVEAVNEKDAAKKLKENTDENLNALHSFSGNYIFSAIVIIIFLIAAYINI